MCVKLNRQQISLRHRLQSGPEHAECFDNAWSATEFAKLMAMPGALSFLAVEGGEPLAFLLARRAADEAEILSIGTRPFARRRGIAKKLMSTPTGMSR